jgi:hypothetical protein
MTAERMRIVLELDVAEGPIAGSLTGEQTPARPFSGWIALGRALEQEVARARTAAAQPIVGASPPSPRLVAVDSAPGPELGHPAAR